MSLPSFPLPQNLVPGYTTQAEVVERYDQPNDQRHTFGLDYWIYRAPAPEMELGFSMDGCLRLVSLPVEEVHNADVEAYYGPPQATYYSPYAPGAQTLAFPERGFTLTVSASDEVVHVAYHESLSLEDYEAHFGRFFPKTDPFADAWGVEKESEEMPPDDEV